MSLKLKKYVSIILYKSVQIKTRNRIISNTYFTYCFAVHINVKCITNATIDLHHMKESCVLDHYKFIFPGIVFYIYDL